MFFILKIFVVCGAIKLGFWHTYSCLFMFTNFPILKIQDGGATHAFGTRQLRHCVE
jgi:hypothetical protein